VDDIHSSWLYQHLEAVGRHELDQRTFHDLEDYGVQMEVALRKGTLLSDTELSEELQQLLSHRYEDIQTRINSGTAPDIALRESLAEAEGPNVVARGYLHPLWQLCFGNNAAFFTIVSLGWLYIALKTFLKWLNIITPDISWDITVGSYVMGAGLAAFLWSRLLGLIISSPKLLCGLPQLDWRCRVYALVIRVVAVAALHGVVAAWVFSCSQIAADFGVLLGPVLIGLLAFAGMSFIGNTLQHPWVSKPSLWLLHRVLARIVRHL